MKYSAQRNEIQNVVRYLHTVFAIQVSEMVVWRSSETNSLPVTPKTSCSRADIRISLYRRLLFGMLLSLREYVAASNSLRSRKRGEQAGKRLPETDQSACNGQSDLSQSTRASIA